MNGEAFFSKEWTKELELFDKDQSDIYFTEEYVRLYENSKDRAECFIYREGNSVLLFPYLKRPVEVLDGEYFDFETAYGYGGPIANSEDPEFTKRAFSSFDSGVRDRNIIAGMVRFHPVLDNRRIFTKKYETIFDRHTVAMDLDRTPEEIWKQELHSSSCRRNITKSTGSGLRFHVDEKLDALEEFTELYRSTMIRIGSDKFYLFSDDYFNGIKRLGKNVCLGSVIFEDKTIAGAIIFKTDNVGHYHLSGSREDFTGLKPNDFLIYKTALYLKEQGMMKFHLGGGATKDTEDSLFQFKARFSKKRYSFYIGKMVLDESIYNKACDIWRSRYPAAEKQYGNLILKYRNTEREQ